MSRWKDEFYDHKGQSSEENPSSDYNCRKRFKLLRKIEQTEDEIKAAEIKKDVESHE